MQKLLSRILLPILTAWLIITPGLATAGTVTSMANALKILPKGANGTVGTAVDVLSLAGRTNPWGIALTVGFGLYSLYYDFTADTGTFPKSQVLPANVAQVPDASNPWQGWSYNSTSGSWLPPSTTTATPQAKYNYAYFGKVYYYDTDTNENRVASCAQLNADLGRVGNILAGYQLPATNFYCKAGAVTTQIYPANVNLCPSGYVASGASCVLSDLNLVKYPSDGIVTFKANADGSGFAADSRDPDSPNVPITSEPFVGVVDGKNTSFQVLPQTGGGLQLQTAQEQLNTDGTVSTYKQTATFDSAGKLVSTDAANYPGGLSAQTPETLPNTAFASASVDLSPLVDQLAAQEQARQAENAAAEAAAAAVVMPENLPNISDFSLPTENTFSGLFPTLNMPSGGGSCVGLNVSLPYMGTMTLDPCGIVAEVQPLIDWMVITLGTLGGILVWMRSDEVSA